MKPQKPNGPTDVPAKQPIRRMVPVLGTCGVCGHLVTLMFEDDEAGLKCGTCCVVELVSSDSWLRLASGH